MAIFDKTTEDQKAETKPVTSRAAVNFRSVLVQPRVSEKASNMVKLGQYVFTVSKNANKISVRKAVEALYHVKVVRVNMINTEGKHRTYGRVSGKMSDFKKAVVTLKKGESLRVGEQ